MFTKYILIQKLNENGWFEQYFSGGGEYVWHHLNRREIDTDDTRIFPVSVSGKCNFESVPQGRETTYVVSSNNKTFKYIENYAVQDGFMIAVRMPKGYIPLTLGFGEKVKLPFGEEKSVSPGYIEVLYNEIEKICTVVFTINKQTNFQFKCTGCFCEDNYPTSLNNYTGTPMNAVIKAHSDSVKAVTSKDLLAFSEYFSKDADLDNTALLINEIKNILNEENDVDEGKIRKHLTELLGMVNTSSSFVTLVDSYNSGNAVYKFITAILLGLQSIG